MGRRSGEVGVGWQQNPILHSLLHLPHAHPQTLVSGGQGGKRGGGWKGRGEEGGERREGEGRERG